MNARSGCSEIWRGRRLDAAAARLSRARAVSGGGLFGYPPGGALIGRAMLDAGSYTLLAATFDPWEGGFELVLFAAPGSATFEAL